MSLFTKKTEAYFSQIHFDLEEHEGLHSILSQTRIDKRTAENMEGSMKISYRNGVAAELFWIEDGDYMEQQIRFKENVISFRDYPINNYRSLVPSEKGIHQLGGVAPIGFNFPSGNTNSPYIYLGFLKNQDETLQWLPFDKVHLICPIYGGFDVIYLDYTDPLVPRLISEIGVEGHGPPEYGITEKSVIEFESAPMSLNKLKNDYLLTGEQYGNAGAPIWVQDNFIPICPVSGNEMRFLLQLDPPGAIKISKTDVNFKDSEYPEYSEVLNFGNGVLYVFMEPEHKTLAYFIQYT